MGLWKKLMGREEDSADAFGQPGGGASVEPAAPAAGGTPLVSFQSTPAEATWSSVTVNGQPLPPEQAQAFTGAFEQLGNLASLGASQVIDLRGRPEIREQVLSAIGEHASDPAALQNAVMSALQAAGVAAGQPLAATTGEAEDPLDRLKKLDELHKAGALTDAEFEAQKKKLLEEL